MMNRRLVAIAILLAAIVRALPAQEAPSVGVRVSPDLWVPLGTTAPLYGLGAGASVEAPIGFGRLAIVQPLAHLSYGFSRLAPEEIDASVSLLRVGAGVASTIPITTRIDATIRASGGYLAAMLSGPDSMSASGLFARGGAGISFAIGPYLSLDLRADYVYHHELNSGLAIGLGATTRVLGEGAGAIPRSNVPPLLRDATPLTGAVRFAQVDVDRLFPVLYTHYSDHPFGSVTLENASNHALEKVSLRLVVEGYMDNPLTCATFDSIAPGETVTAELRALFNAQVLSITEGTRVAGRLDAAYRSRGVEGSTSETITVELYDRNALRWDDDRKVAVFVTAKDDEVQRFAKNVAAGIRDREIATIDANFQRALVLLEAMSELGVSYEIDPSSSYAALSQDSVAVDYVQFPRQTLQFRAGDCDDLSVTYCSLLEALGVPTAFITVPGHIFAAFRLVGDEATARRSFVDTTDIIFREDGTAWVPIETTILRRSFLEAWSEGARQWRDANGKGQADFIETAAAWREYEPVAFGIGTAAVSMPDEATVVNRFVEELDRFIQRQIYLPEQTLLSRIRRNPNDLGARNRLGVLYARYGKYDQARTAFDAVLRTREHAPSLVNMGHLAYLDGDLQVAKDYYGRALARDPDCVTACLGLAQVNHQLENYGDAEAAYDRLVTLDPERAGEVSYLRLRGPDATRASDAANPLRTILWEEDDE